MNQLDFVSAVNAIAAKRPTYRTGGTGADGTCDCVGLIMGAIGKKYDLHSTNYFARFQMRTKDSLLDESQLHEGSVVYKSRRDASQLNERYQPGGTHHAGDSLDYYHMGVVTGIDPLKITHCTSTNNVNGIAYDNSIRAWSHFGDLLDVEYTEDYEQEEAQTETALFELAVVYTEDGNPVHMRSTPSTKLPYIAKIPNGAQVEVLESTGEWATVRWNGQRGYMMTEFLRFGNETLREENNNAVIVTLPRETAQTLLAALMQAVK